MDILADLRCVQRTRGETFSSAEVVGMVGRAADEIERLRAALDIARTALLTIERRCEEYRAQITRTIEQTSDQPMWRWWYSL